MRKFFREPVALFSKQNAVGDWLAKGQRNFEEAVEVRYGAEENWSGGAVYSDWPEEWEALVIKTWALPSRKECISAR